MKIQVPFNYNDELRKAMNYYLEKARIAWTYGQEMRSWFYKYGISRDVEILSYYRGTTKKKGLRAPLFLLEVPL